MAESLFVKADEVSEVLGISRAEAYRIIKRLNGELAAKGYIVINGRVNRRYLEEQIYGYRTECPQGGNPFAYLHSEKDILKLVTTLMSNYHLRGKNLSNKARGLLSTMLSLPENWDYTKRGLASPLQGTVCVYRSAQGSQVYHELFDEALAEYNAKQTRRDRMIDDYYEKICTGKQEKPFYEVIFQIGSKDNMSVGTPEEDKAKEILNEFMQGFEERNPHLQVFSAHLHMDEATPHLHIDFVPYISGSKRGLSTRVSLKKALEAQGFKGEGKTSNERNLWVESEKDALAEIMERHGIDWEKKGTHLEHLDVLNFKKEQRAKELSELEQKIEQLTPDVKNMEMFVAEFSQDPDKMLPEAAPLETAKSYREKKVKPFFEQMKKLVLSTHAVLVKLRRECIGLTVKYHAAIDKIQSQENELKDKDKEINKLKLKLRDFDRVKTFFGKDKINQAIESVKQQEKEHKQKRKSISR